MIDGRDVTGLAPAERRISMVFQSYALFPHLSVRENILFGVKVRKEPAADFAQRLARVAHLLGLTALLERKPSQLSGGQQQRVALGRAIIAETKVCLMDEPLSNLDAQLRQEMRREIRTLQQSLGMTMVYVTHDQTEAMSMADQVRAAQRRPDRAGRAAGRAVRATGVGVRGALHRHAADEHRRRAGPARSQARRSPRARAHGRPTAASPRSCRAPNTSAPIPSSPARHRPAAHSPTRSRRAWRASTRWPRARASRLAWSPADSHYFDAATESAPRRRRSRSRLTFHRRHA